MINLRSIAYLLFLFSGFAGLVYQVVWARQLSAIFGSSAESMAAVLAIYMLGLALGGLVLGRAADRAGSSFLFFAILEGTIGLYGLAAASGFGFLENLYFSGGAPQPSLKYVLAGMYMFIPCFLIGGTLPALSRFCLGDDPERCGLAAGGLYAVNTLGAAAGALMTGFVFLENFGAMASIRLAGCINLAVAAIAMALFFAARKQSSLPAAAATSRGASAAPSGRATASPSGGAPADPSGGAPTEKASTSLSHGPSSTATSSPGWPARFMILAALFMAGTATLAGEVIWTRILSQFFKNSVYSFSTMLFAVLVGMSLGGGAGSLLTRWVKRGCYVLGLVQVLAAMASLVMVLLVLPYTHVQAYLREVIRFGGFESFANLAVFEVVAAFYLVLLPAFLMGMSFPLMAHLAWRPVSRFGGFIGDIQFVLTLGNVTGALGMALYLVPLDGGRFGMLNCVLCIAGANLVAALFLWASRPANLGWIRWAGAGALLVAAGLIYSSLPDDLRFWRNAPAGETLLFYTSDKIAEVAVVERPDGRVLKVNNTSGLGGTAGNYVETRLGMLPLILRGGSERALVMGLGTGNTLAGLLSVGAQDVDCVEIIPGVAAASRQCFHNFEPSTPAGGQLRIFLDDARVFLRAMDDQYDLILGDLYFPWQSEAGFMYTEEHFRRVKERLSDEGVFFQWLPLHQLRWEEFGIIGYTFSEVFDHVAVFLAAPNVAFPIVGLAGSKKMLNFNPLVLQERLDRHFPPELLKAYELDRAMDILALYLGNEWRFRSQLFSETQVNTEDRTVVEYRSARVFEDSAVLSITNFRKLADPRFKEDPVPLLGLDEMGTKPRLKLEDQVRSYSKAMSLYLGAHGLVLREELSKRLGWQEEARQVQALRETLATDSLQAYGYAPDFPLTEGHLLRVWTFFIHEQQYAAANNLMAHALSISPDNDVFYNKLGLGLMVEKRYGEAAVCLASAVAKDDKNYSARANLAIAMFLTERRVEAREEMDKVIQGVGYKSLSELTAALAVLILEGRQKALPVLEPFMENSPWTGLVETALKSAKASGLEDQNRRGGADDQ